MNILALDLSTKSTGYAISQDNKLIKYGVITQSNNKHFIDRIYNIVSEILILIKEYNIEKIYCEEVQFGDVNTHTFKTLFYLQSHLVCETHMSFPQIDFEFFQPNQHRAKVGIQTGRGIRREVLKQKAIEYAKTHYNIIVNDDIADAITILDAAINDAQGAEKGDLKELKAKKPKEEFAF